VRCIVGGDADVVEISVSSLVGDNTAAASDAVVDI
jgi:hypothetical protein